MGAEGKREDALVTDSVNAVRRGGSGPGPRLVVIHGAGANGDVFARLTPYLDRWPGAWIIPDLLGHGAAPSCGVYGVGIYAAGVAALLEQNERVVVLGHSLGGAVGWALATQTLGVEVERVLSFDVKVDWTDEEILKARKLADAPVRWFDQRADAVAFYLKVSGLHGFAELDSPEALSGVEECEGRWRLRTEPRTYAASGAQTRPLLQAVLAPRHLGTGAVDAMMSPALARSLDPDAQIFDGCGHNPHIQRPDLVWDWVEAVALRER